MPSEQVTNRFLYTILKQLDMRNVDWPAVAQELNISNGHAARMRYSRFRQSMENNNRSNNMPRTPSPKAARPGQRRNNRKSLETKQENFIHSDEVDSSVVRTISPRELQISPLPNPSPYFADYGHCFNCPPSHSDEHHCCSHLFMAPENPNFVGLGGTFEPVLIGGQDLLNNGYSPTLAGPSSGSFDDVFEPGHEKKESFDSMQSWN